MALHAYKSTEEVQIIECDELARIREYSCGGAETLHDHCTLFAHAIRDPLRSPPGVWGGCKDPRKSRNNAPWLETTQRSSLVAMLSTLSFSAVISMVGRPTVPVGDKSLARGTFHSYRALFKGRNRTILGGLKLYSRCITCRT